MRYKSLYIISILLLSVILLNCKNTKVVNLPFDVSIEQYKFEDHSRKNPPYWIKLSDDQCYTKFLNYFTDGIELILRFDIRPEFNEKMSIGLNYFNHLISPEAYFYSTNDTVLYDICTNDYLIFNTVWDQGYAVKLKSGESRMIMRLQFPGCNFKDGFLRIKLGIYFNEIDVNSDSLNYLNSWLVDGLYFPVTDGKISEKPFYNKPSKLRNLDYEYFNYKN